MKRNAKRALTVILFSVIALLLLGWFVLQLGAVLRTGTAPAQRTRALGSEEEAMFTPRYVYLSDGSGLFSRVESRRNGFTLAFETGLELLDRALEGGAEALNRNETAEYFEEAGACFVFSYTYCVKSEQFLTLCSKSKREIRSSLEGIWADEIWFFPVLEEGADFAGFAGHAAETAPDDTVTAEGPEEAPEDTEISSEQPMLPRFSEVIILLYNSENGSARKLRTRIDERDEALTGGLAFCMGFAFDNAGEWLSTALSLPNASLGSRFIPSEDAAFAYITQAVERKLFRTEEGELHGARARRYAETFFGSTETLQLLQQSETQALFSSETETLSITREDEIRFVAAPTLEKKAKKLGEAMLAARSFMKRFIAGESAASETAVYLSLIDYSETEEGYLFRYGYYINGVRLYLTNADGEAEPIEAGLTVENGKVRRFEGRFLGLTMRPVREAVSLEEGMQRTERVLIAPQPASSGTDSGKETAE